MPIRINGRVIEQINGPYSLTMLRPIENDNIYNNYFMLFGDCHSNENYQPINKYNERAIELYPEFINELNIFAKNNTTEFYIEKFFEESNFINFKNKDDAYFVFSDILTKIRNDPHNIQHYLNEYDDIIQKLNASDKLRYDLEFYKKNLYYFLNIPTGHKNILPQKSNMIEIIHVYKNCFLHDNSCKFKNIKWHYADLRVSYSYYFKNKKNQIIQSTQSYEALSMFREVFTKTLMTFINFQSYKSNKDDVNELYFSDKNILTFYEEFKDTAYNISAFDYSQSDIFFDLIHNYIINMLTNDDAYAEGILNSYKIKKRYDNLSVEGKQLFTKESLIELIKYIKSKIYTEFYDITIFVEFIKKIKSYLFDLLNELEKLNILNWLNSTEVLNFLTIENIEKINNICIVSSNVILDFYFILRSYTSIIPKKNNQKLITSYFGSNHVDAIAHYFTNIVKTHTIMFDKSNKIRRIIHIDTDINLDLIFNSTDIQILSKILFSNSGKTRSKKNRNNSKKGRNIMKKIIPFTRRRISKI